MSGSIDAIEVFRKDSEDRGLQIASVNSNVAFHSPIFKPLAKRLNDLLARAGLDPMEPTVRLYTISVFLGKLPLEQAPRDATYCSEDMKTPVYLASAIEAAAEDDYRIFLEVSPHPIISHSVTQTLKGMEIDDFAVIPTMLRNMSSIRCLIRSCASLWCNGIKVDWKAQFSKIDWTRTVPKTQWKHESLWMNTTSDSADKTALHDPDTNTLLGQEIAVFGENVTMFKSRLSEEMKPLPGNHPLHGTRIIPAAILLNTFLQATGTHCLENFEFKVPVAISAPRVTQVLIKGHKVRFSSQLINPDERKGDSEPETSWVKHTAATFGFDSADDVAFDVSDNLDLPKIRERIGTKLMPTFSIDYLRKVGVSEMGFPWAVKVHMGNEEEMLATLDVNPLIEDGSPLPWSESS